MIKIRYFDCAWEVDYVKNDIFHGMDIDMKVLKSDEVSNVNEADVLILNHTIPFDKIGQLVKRAQPSVIFHFSDEDGTRQHFLSLSQHTKLLFRQHNVESYEISKYPNIFQIPLGYMTGMFNGKCSLDTECKLVEERKYDCSFVGVLKQDRKIIIDKFKENFEKFYYDVSGKVSLSELKKIYQDSIFLPNGRGNRSLDCFRIYEGMIHGAIPVVIGHPKEIKITFDYDGDPPPFIHGQSWDDIIIVIKWLLKEKWRIVDMQLQVQGWWRNQMKKIQNQIMTALSK